MTGTILTDNVACFFLSDMPCATGINKPLPPNQYQKPEKGKKKGLALIGGKEQPASSSRCLFAFCHAS